MKLIQLPVIALLSILLFGCTAETSPHLTVQADLFTGVWLGAAGNDSFVFEFHEVDRDSCPGMIHCISEGKKYSEVLITEVEFNPPEIHLFIESTGVTYTGIVSDSIIDGEISSPGAPSITMNLVRTESDEIAGLEAFSGEYSYTVPRCLDDNLPTGNCNDLGVSSIEVEEIMDGIASGEAGVIHSLLILSEGNLVVEEYFHGYTMDDLHRLASVTKSVSSLLVGIAIDLGYIDSVSVPLHRFFAGAEDRLTLEHLLTMSMDLQWSDEEAENLHETGEEFFTYVMQREINSEPGQIFRYVNPVVNLISGILKESTGLFPDEFAEESLFDPLGITNYDWQYGETNGHRLMDGSLHLRPRDMAKIGLLVIDNGSWNQTELVSENWIRSSTETHIPVDDLFNYGYLWWLKSVQTESGDTKAIMASGWGSQFIVVIPEMDLVIVVTGGNEDNGKNWAVLQLIQEVLFR